MARTVVRARKTMEMRRLELKIYGDVQGVFFRQAAQEKAKNLGLVGFAKNSSDGSVEIIIQGEEQNLKEFLKWAKKGPTSAKVEKVEIRWSDKLEEFDDFKVVY